MAESGRNTQSEFWQRTSLPMLYDCWCQARRNKSQSLRVQRFGDDPLRYLLTIQQRLRERTYSFGPYKEFTVREKKFRHVVDAPMKDRVVHWMLYRYMLPIWQHRFIADTFGNLTGRGTHAAVRRVAEFARAPRNAWVLQLEMINALVLDADMVPISDDFRVANDDFAIVEAFAAARAADGMRCCISWTRESDGMAAYWGPKGATHRPHWYAPLGRPAKMIDGKRVNVYLDASSLARAAELGDGSVSEGIRRALRPTI